MDTENSNSPTTTSETQQSGESLDECQEQTSKSAILRNSSVDTESSDSCTATAENLKPGEPLGECKEQTPKSATPRNPITGLGLNGDGIGFFKQKTLRGREGNPVTGEGYKTSKESANYTPSKNGTNQIINKNRVPPGGYSSGLW